MMMLWLGLAGVLMAQVITPPAIGGPPAALEQVLGAPNDATIASQLHYLRCAGTDVDQYVVSAPNDQVWTIERYYCDLGVPPVGDRFAEAARFLPPDAVGGDPTTTAEGDSAQMYVSQSFASALPPQLFHDCAGQPVTAGTIIVVADASGWFVGPGTCA